MERLTGEDAGQRVSMKTVASASFAGALLEWYDFALYGTAAALIFNQLFFPNVDPTTGTIASLATYGAAFVARPIGGVVFGHFGDRVGRKSMLVITMLILGLSTFFIGLLPTYESIGIWAPILLLLLRLLQGLGLGGEYGGAALLTVEHSPRSRRGFWGSLPQVGVPAGVLLSTGVLAIFATLPEEQFLSWGWRIPFLLSILLLAVGLFVRLRILETPAFAQVKETGTEARMPIMTLVRTYPRNLLLAFGARLVDSAGATVFNTVAIAYTTTQLGLPTNMILTGILIASAVEIFLLPTFGALSDRIGRRPVYMAGAALVGLFAFPFFWLLGSETPVLIWLAIVFGFAVCTGLTFSVQATFFTELFGTRVRYSGLSLVYQLSAIIGGLTPFIAASLIAWTGGSPWPVAVYLVALALVALTCVYLLRETFQTDVSESESRHQQEYAASGNPSGGSVS